VITTPIEHRAHPLGGEPRVVDDRTIRVRSPGLLSHHRTLAMQSSEDRLHCGVGQFATDRVADLAGRERPVRRPQRGQDLRFQAARGPPCLHHAHSLITPGAGCGPTSCCAPPAVSYSSVGLCSYRL
jgi:hypothetical protein